MKAVTKRIAKLEAQCPANAEFDGIAFLERLMDDGILSDAELHVLAGQGHCLPADSVAHIDLATVVAKIEAHAGPNYPLSWRSKDEG